VDSEISIDPPFPTDLIAAMKRIKSGRVAGICDITPKPLKQCGSMGMDRLLSWELFKAAWESERKPEDWTCCIILPFWKKKGSRE